KLLKEPKNWLMTLEELLEKNLHLFTTWQTRMKTEWILVQTTFLFQEIENNRFQPGKKYDITEVKMKLRQFRTFVEQLTYLYELKTEYLQDKFKIVDYSEMSFDQLLIIEIEKVEHLRMSLERSKPKKVVSKNSLSEDYIDNNEFIIKMNISKRTAQIWRDKGLISFHHVSGKIYYKVTDVELMLQQNYVKPFKK